MTTNFEKFTIGGATLYRADCRDVMATIAGVAAVVSDPPYGMAYRHSGKGARVAGRKSLRRHAEVIQGDEHRFDPALWVGYPKVILFGANHYADRLPASAGWLVWDKKDMMKSNSFSDAELAWSKGIGNSVRRFRYLWNGVCQAGEKGQKRFHPNQKPIALMEWAISLCRLGPHDLVADPYMGAGSTGIAAVRLGLRFVGVEIEARHFDNACRRIEQEAARCAA